MLSFCSVGSLFVFYRFPLACVFRCTPTVLSAGVLDIALINFLCLSPVSICVCILVPRSGGSSYSALVDLKGRGGGGGAFPQFWTWLGGLGSYCFSFLISAHFCSGCFLCFWENVEPCSYRPLDSSI